MPILFKNGINHGFYRKKARRWHHKIRAIMINRKCCKLMLVISVLTLFIGIFSFSHVFINGKNIIKTDYSTPIEISEHGLGHKHILHNVDRNLLSDVAVKLLPSITDNLNQSASAHREHSLMVGYDQIQEGYLLNKYDFDIDGEDVLVFLHIQKTGGTTFGKHLVKNLDIDHPCVCYKGKKQCDCYSKKHKIWLFSRYSTGWVCGLHADWTELQHCVDEALDHVEGGHSSRRYLYITLLRNPMFRYLSEWKHVQRGATWKTTFLKCNGRQATLDEVPYCWGYLEKDWSDVSLEDFMECPHNLAVNRQTRMLANLSLVNCYNMTSMPKWQRNHILLESAKRNLQDMAFFGLTEQQADTQFMFENTFDLDFIDDFEQRDKSKAQSQKTNLTIETEQKILHLNALDVELYKFAQQLFNKRLSQMKTEKNTRRRLKKLKNNRYKS